MTFLAIGADALDAIARAAEAAWPEEACGLLVGLRGQGGVTVRRVTPAPNVADDPRRRFEVDPRTLFAAHRAARDAGEEILGPWHSHPDGRAAPSPTDSARAQAAGETWLIVPVTEGRAGTPRAWAFDGRAFGEIALRS